MKLVLTIIISIMQVLIVLIPIKGKLKDNRYRFPKNFTSLGYLLISCCIITTLSTISIFIISENEEKNSKAELSSRLAERDSINQTKMNNVVSIYSDKIDSSNKITIEILAKYGLKYDSVQNRIEKLIKDSTKKNVTIIQENLPVINVCSENGIKLKKSYKDSFDLEINFCYNYSPAKININVAVLMPRNGKWYLVGKVDNFIKRDSPLDLEGAIGKLLPLIVANTSNTLYFKINGNYTNKKGDLTYIINDVVTFNIAKQEQGLALDNIKNEIDKFLSYNKL